MPFLNIVRFKKKLRKYYNMSDEEAQAEWEAALRDPKVPKGTDDFGGVTIAKLKTDVYSAGRSVGSKREIREKGVHSISDSSQIANLTRGREDGSFLRSLLWGQGAREGVLAAYCGAVVSPGLRSTCRSHAFFAGCRSWHCGLAEPLGEHRCNVAQRNGEFQLRINKLLTSQTGGRTKVARSWRAAHLALWPWLLQKARPIAGDQSRRRVLLPVPALQKQLLHSVRMDLRRRQWRSPKLSLLPRVEARILSLKPWSCGARS